MKPKTKKILFVTLLFLALGFSIYFYLPKEIITMIDIPPIKLPPIIIP